MTRVQLRESIKREARIKSAATLDTLVDDIINDIFRDLTGLARYYELLVENEEITLVAAQQAYDLPATFQNMSGVRYGRGPSPTVFRDIILQTSTIKQTWSGGYPRFYRLVAGPKISFWPYADVVVADQLLIDYYRDPITGLFEDDADPFPVPRLESTVKKSAIARVQRFHSSMPEAKMMTSDAGQSFNSSQASG